MSKTRPVVDLVLSEQANEIRFNNPLVSADYSTDTLSAAAGIVRSEFLRKGDWYNALVGCICDVLMENSSEIDVQDLAQAIAARVIG